METPPVTVTRSYSELRREVQATDHRAKWLQISNWLAASGGISCRLLQPVQPVRAIRGDRFNAPLCGPVANICLSTIAIIDQQPVDTRALQRFHGGAAQPRGNWLIAQIRRRG